MARTPRITTERGLPMTRSPERRRPLWRVASSVSAVVWVIAVLGASGCQQANAGSAQVGAELRDGDIILHRGHSSQANAIIEATDSRYTHVGLIDVTDSGIQVIEAVGPVQRTKLADFVARSIGKTTVLRHAGVDETKGRAIVKAAEAYLGRPYDPYFLMGTGRIYCSELIWLAYKDAGIRVGQVERFADLQLSGAAVEKLLKARWRRHPLCKQLKSFRQCRKRIQSQQIITPVGLTRDGKLASVNF